MNDKTYEEVLKYYGIKKPQPASKQRKDLYAEVVKYYQDIANNLTEKLDYDS